MTFSSFFQVKKYYLAFKVLYFFKKYNAPSMPPDKPNNKSLTESKALITFETEMNAPRPTS